MSADRYQEILDEITEDLELQAGIILTPDQLLTLHRTQQIRFAKADLEPYNIAGIKSYLHDTPAEARVWDCYQSMSDESFVIAIRLTTQYVTIMLV